MGQSQKIYEYVSQKIKITLYWTKQNYVQQKKGTKIYQEISVSLRISVRKEKIISTIASQDNRVASSRTNEYEHKLVTTVRDQSLSKPLKVGLFELSHPSKKIQYQDSKFDSLLFIC